MVPSNRAGKISSPFAGVDTGLLHVYKEENGSVAVHSFWDLPTDSLYGSRASLYLDLWRREIE